MNILELVLGLLGDDWWLSLGRWLTVLWIVVDRPWEVGDHIWNGGVYADTWLLSLGWWMNMLELVYGHLGDDWWVSFGRWVTVL